MWYGSLDRRRNDVIFKCSLYISDRIMVFKYSVLNIYIFCIKYIVILCLILLLIIYLRYSLI